MFKNVALSLVVLCSFGCNREVGRVRSARAVLNELASRESDCWRAAMEREAKFDGKTTALSVAQQKKIDADVAEMTSNQAKTYQELEVAADGDDLLTDYYHAEKSALQHYGELLDRDLRETKDHDNRIETLRGEMERPHRVDPKHDEDVHSEIARRELKKQVLDNNMQAWRCLRATHVEGRKQIRRIIRQARLDGDLRLDLRALVVGGDR